MTNSVKLAQGVNLHLISSKKFKTIHLVLRFREKITKENLSARSLLSSILTVSNAKYPSSRDFQIALAKNYGMRLGAGVSSKGCQHNLSFAMNVVESRYLGEDSFAEALDFLHEVIFNPLLVEGQFDSKIFELEVENLRHYLDSMTDDNAYLAALGLDRLFYANEEMALPSHGTIDLLQELNSKRLYSYYQEMLAGNAVDIFVLGNIDEAEMVKAFEKWNFKDRPELEDLFYQQETSPLREEEIIKEAFQAQLAMAWSHPIQYGDPDYLALQLLNGLYGGQPNSKLFSVVRERESLAYGISSRFDSFTGMFALMAGVDSENLARVEALSLELLEEIKEGAFSEEDLVQTKSLIRNAYLVGKDSPSGLMELAFVRELKSNFIQSDEAWLNALEAVTKEDVQRVARTLKLEVVYKLKGKFEDD